MPQLDLSLYPTQAFWLIACFCLLWLLNSWLITPKITDILEQRKRKINEYLYKAEQLNIQAKTSLDKYNQALQDVQSKIATDMDLAKKEVEVAFENAENRLNQKIKEQISQQEQDLAKEKSLTLKNAQNISEVIALQIMQKLGINEADTQIIKEFSQKDSK